MLDMGHIVGGGWNPIWTKAALSALFVAPLFLRRFRLCYVACLGLVAAVVMGVVCVRDLRSSHAASLGVDIQRSPTAMLGLTTGVVSQHGGLALSAGYVDTEQPTRPSTKPSATRLIAFHWNPAAGNSSTSVDPDIRGEGAAPTKVAAEGWGLRAVEREGKQAASANGAGWGGRSFHSWGVVVPAWWGVAAPLLVSMLCLGLHRIRGR